MSSKFLKIRVAKSSEIQLVNVSTIQSIKSHVEQGYFYLCWGNAWEKIEIISGNGSPIKTMDTLISHLDIVAAKKSKDLV